MRARFQASCTCFVANAAIGSKFSGTARMGYAFFTNNSTNNTAAPRAFEDFVRITHPFHPFSGRRLLCVAVRYNRYGKRFLLQIDDSTICSVPPQWTDIVPPDPEMVLGRRRALFRVADLFELERLVGGLVAE